ncbi:ROK family transcriptional regulator [Undibacterium sp. Ji50W]|uniref:ROK family transcriptional regulator n=1 Tax=Undibacterium sp. Ji50W TaxID=3413041 RepID=UPI003BF3381A
MPLLPLLPLQNNPHANLRFHSKFSREVRAPVTVTANERQLLDLVRRKVAVTRADLARVTGLAAQSVMRLVDDLAARGLLVFTDALPSKARGKPSPQIALVADFAFCIGASIATDEINLVLIDFAGNLIGQSTKRMTPITRLDLCSYLRIAIDQLLDLHPMARNRLFGVGVGMTGFFVGQGSRLNPPAPLDDLALIDLDLLLEKEIGYPVWLDNDGNAAAIGESLLGVGMHCQNFAYLFFSHGFGGGIVYQGQCMRGAHGNAGEFAGFLPGQGLERPTLEMLRLMCNEDGQSFTTIHDMLEHLDLTWPCVERWIERCLPALTLVVSAIVGILDTERIVLGGRLPKALADRLIARLVIDNIPRRGVQRPQAVIVASEISGDATAIGAASLPLKQHFFF